MNKRICKIAALFLAAVLCFVLTACTKKTAGEDLWAQAVYTEDATFGTGDKTLQVEVVAGEQSVTFTLHSDKQTVGEALSEHNLVEGEKGAYGLYVKKVNGIVADYDVNQSYWAFSKGGESMMTGVDGAAFSDGEHFELTYTK